ncbi:MFS transporter [Aestuariimicrobium ganziense]|uniref:MFS transporter n=1 Tax=Aestuariimicrobium ganziense TaxID=2773677 RepID=UPI0019426276|nr:MFS transporter [Aestuariimicrobium ganziense]
MTSAPTTAHPERPTQQPRQTSPFGYALGMLGMSIPMNMIRGSMILFYVDILGLDVRAYGTVMLVYAVIDAIDNPVLGHLSDRTRTRFGRRRPWLVVGTTVMAAAFVGFFSAPDSLEGLGLVAWFTVFALLCEAADSMISANYGALLPELFPVEKRRAVANSLRQGMQLVAMIIALALTPLLTTSVFGTETTTEGFRTTALIYAAIALVALGVMVASVRENPSYEHEHRPRFLASIRDIITTKLFWTIGLASACYLIPLAMVLAGLQLYVKYTLGLAVAQALVIQGVVILVAAGFLAIWTRVIRRRGAPWVWRVSFGFLAAGFVPLYFATNLATAVAAGCVIAVGWAGLMATNDLIQARLLDEDARRHGVHREGIFLSAFGFFGRLSGGMNGLALASLAMFFGYVSGNDPGPQPDRAFQVYMSVYPFIVAVVGLVLALLTRVPSAGAHAVDEPEAATVGEQP